MTRQDQHLNRLKEAQARATRTSLEMAERALEARNQHGNAWQPSRSEARTSGTKESKEFPLFANSEYSSF